MTDFLSPTPSSVDIMFDSPRTQSTSGSGLIVSHHRPQAAWRGKVSFAPVVRGTANPLLSVAEADQPNRGFFVDLAQANEIAVDTNGVPTAPTWFDAVGNSTVEEVGLAVGHGAVAGDLVSIRQSARPEFVTARRILSIEIDGSAINYARLDAVLPHEYFPVTSATTLQYCVDRPHCRAQFINPPQRWVKRDPTFMSPTTADWAEDTAASVLALRAVSGETGVVAGILLDQNGEPVLDEDGREIQT